MKLIRGKWQVLTCLLEVSLFVQSSFAFPSSESQTSTPAEVGNFNYSLLASTTRFCMDTTNEDSSQTIEKDENENPNCEKLGILSEMQYGHNPYLISNSPYEFRKRVFDFTCNETHNPYEIISKEVTLIPCYDEVKMISLNFSKQSLTSTIINEMKVNELGKSLFTSLIKGGFRGFSGNESVTYDTTTSVRDTALMTGFTPNREILDEFMKLPEELEGNVKIYFDFINMFGSHVINRVEVGIKSTTLMDNWFAFQYGDVPVDEQVEIHLRRQLDRLINPTYIPISRIIEKGWTNRSANFEQMIQFEEQIWHLDGVKFLLDYVAEKTKFTKFLGSLLESEVGMVCPSEDIVRTIQQEIVETGNIDGKQFGIDCTVDSGSNSTRYSYDLVSGVCLDAPINQLGCTSITFRFPAGVKCLIAYELSGCYNLEYESTGVGKTFALTEWDPTFQDALSTRSFRFCDSAESKEYE